MRTWFDGTAEGVRSNDTIEIDIPFRNYYATDDGSAERAYGVLNQTNARVAFLFQPLQPDTLHGFFINFAHSGVDVTLNSFRLCVWANSNGEPGNPIYISDSLYKPRYGFYHNDFIPYELEEGVYIPGDVFVGFIQASTAGLYVGLDVNTPQENKFYGNGFFWFNSLASGTLMIRPYFRYTPLNFSVEESEVQKQVFSVYPNPAQNEININSHDSKIFWMLFNQLGIAVMSGQEQSINTAQLPRGAYFLKIESEQRVENHKIILQ
jgi:hypothetical protein